MKTINQNQTDILTFQSLINNFMLASQIEGKAERTLEQYCRVLIPFSALVENKAPEEITPADLREYLSHLSKKGLSKQTVWTHYKQLRVFFGFCHRESYLKTNPMELIRKPKVDKLLPKVLTADEIKALLKTAKGKGFLGKRNAALVALMFDSGLRASEVCGLKLTDVSLENQVVRVFGKGSKERIIPFSKTTAKLLLSYLKARGNRPYEEGFFISRYGDKLTRHGLIKVYKCLAQKAKIDKSKVSPHVLRHSFATAWCRAGGDVKKLQFLMGHADVRTTGIYVHLTAKDLSQAHSEFSPLERLK
ncbi:MAG: hypothetical protein C4562_05415 [Actinobacteria bacterium]|nr:MAG: hypothetical protein C4562_05415 [Actinomycetota bacterium]